MKKPLQIEGLIQAGETPPAQEQEQPIPEKDIDGVQRQIVEAALATMIAERKARNRKIGRRLVK